MEGYILLNSLGQSLTWTMLWSFTNPAAVWTGDELKNIKNKSLGWFFPPTHRQRAKMEHGKIILIGEKETL